MNTSMAITARELVNLMPDMTQVESREPELESSLHYMQLVLLDLEPDA